ncbi:MAG: hypothetical protein U9N59_08010 [Campylobacterota bacterium]|nr:hypothetical protein [Campylobacterota bacterium]
MFEQEETIKIFKITFKEVLRRLSSVENCPKEKFEQKVIEQFDDYNYEGEEELQGIENWCDISNDGEYKLNVGIDHEDAYEFTLYVRVKDKKATIFNVL